VEASLTSSFFLIFSGAAVLASLALFTRQPLLIAYIALGAIIGPHGAGWVSDVKLLAEIAEFGIIFLLFLLGLDMQPKALLATLKKATVVAIVSSMAFAAIGYALAASFGFSTTECAVIGAAMMFSSTIIGIKLLPTTALHHRHTGELMVGLLLLQDLIAIFVLMILLSISLGDFSAQSLFKTLIALPLLVVFAFTAVRWVLLPLLRRFDRFHEYIFLLAIGWCLGMTEAAHTLGLSSEIGAFLGGISLATSPISQYIAINLKPLRDFFLILFFFSLGARFDLGLLSEIIVPASILAALVLVLKPIIFRFLIHGMSETKQLAWNLGFRMGQISEFSLLIAYVATEMTLIGREASHLIQATAIISFVVSSYIVVLNYPTPIGISDKLRRD
jgi:Kef-type K+ transport system membrane component KefB